MIVQEKTQQVELDVARSVSFGIRQENLQHVFNVLRNSLYSDKIKAVIREYSTNAFDAHVEAGCEDRPFQVHLPSLMEPTFWVRDFGPGLSQEGIEEIFASYGASTKRNTNAQVGMLGLGSKSAFCYVQNFTIISFYNGVKTVYSAYLDKTNIGQITTMHAEPTEEENGIRVEFAVNPGDVRRFKDTAVQVYQWFAVKPEFVGAEDITIGLNQLASRVPMYMGEGWELYGGGEALVVMGGVAYPIDASQFDRDKETRLRSLVNSANLVLHAPIGAVKNSASRESLEYNDTTMEFLRRKLGQVVRDLRAQAAERISAAETLWAAKVELHKLKDAPYYVRDIFTSQVEWRGQVLPGALVAKAAMDAFGKAGIQFKTYEFNSWSDKLRSYVVTSVACKPGQTLAIFTIGDFGQNQISGRIRQLREDTNEEIVLVFCPDKKAATLFVEHAELEGAPIVFLSDVKIKRDRYLPKKAARSHVETDKRKAKVFEWNGLYAPNIPADAWDIAEETLEEGEGVYIRIDKYTPAPTEWETLRDTSLNGLDNFKTLLRGLDIPVPTIYGIRTSVPDEKIGAKWKPLGVYLKEQLNKKMRGLKIADIRAYIQYAEKVDGLYTQLFDLIPKLGKGPLAQFVRALKEYRTDKRVAFVKNLAQSQYRLSLSLPEATTDPTVINLQAQQEEVEGLYPMLRHMRQCGSYRLVGEYADEFVRFVRIVDASLPQA